MSTATAPETNHTALTQVEQQEQIFALAQRKARVYSESTLVPQEYRGNIGNVLIAENMAHRMGADTLMVMQNLYVVHGKPGWSAVFLISCFNTCGRFSAIKYRFRSDADHPEEWGCQAYCTEIATGEEIAGTWVTWTMASAEGWVQKNGSKWKTMPEQMFRYRAATFLIRATAPEIGMGLLTKDELEDMTPLVSGHAEASAQPTGIAAVKDHLKLGTAETDETEPADHIDATILERPEDIDPLEKKRANVTAALEGLPKTAQKNVMQGRPFIKDSDDEQLDAILAAIAEETK